MRKPSKMCEDLEPMGNNLDLGLVSEAGGGKEQSDRAEAVESDTFSR